MGEWLQNYIEQLKELWQKLNKRAKIIIGLSVIGVFVALSFLIILGGGGNYKPLFEQLSARDADAIVNRLEEENINYKITDDGSTIMVPADVVDEARLDMAGAGLPEQGVVGFEIFDQTNFGTTDFERKVNFYRALGGELSRTIQNMNIVEYARVQITAPRESLYIDKEQPAEASVLIKLVHGYNIEKNQINAISNLVAGSVQSLKKENVTIVDTNGNLLTANSGDNEFSSSQMTANQFEMEREFENKLKSDLRTMLLKVLGPGNFAIQVNAGLNFDKRETESKTYSPVVDDKGIVRSQESHEVTQEGTQNAADGVPGVTSNTPQEEGTTRYQGEDELSETSSYESTDTITNYEINEKIEKHVYAPGELENLSVSVILNNEQDEETVEKIRSAVQAAIGYKQSRDDVVNVTSINFDESLEEQVSKAQAEVAAADRTKMYIYAGLIAFILIMLLTVFFVLRKSGEEEYEAGQAVDMMVGESVEQAAEETAATELSEEEKERRQMKEDLEEIVNERPAEVAQLLKSWLQEE